MKIKVCGLTDPNNITHVVRLSPDFMGFVFYEKSPRYAGELEANVIKSIPGYINKVGVFVNEQPEKVLILAKHYGLTHLQLHGNESPEECELLGSFGYRIIKAFAVDEHFETSLTEKFIDSCHYFLFDTKSEKHGGSGRKFDWRILSYYDFKRPVILSGGIGPEDGEEIIKLKLNIHGIDVNSRFETEPGIKNIKKLEQFILQLT